MLRRQNLTLQHLHTFILDEADEMLSRGFAEQIQDISGYCPVECQIILCSATIPEPIIELSRQFMKQPKSILVKREQLTLEGIKQFFIDVDTDQNKYATLKDLYETLTITQAIIFCNTRTRVIELTQKMTANHFTVSAIHGE
uniref:Eukaryotic initiation factor 4A n=1 Tax=Lygus hesperus TaxID=30085 RepID=A0A0A9YJ95_LYGHE